MAKPFLLISGHPALDFVNTLDWRFRNEGPEELLPAYADLVRFTEQSKLIGHKTAERLVRTVNDRSGIAVLESCREFREAMAEVMYETGAPLDTLEHYFKDASGHQKLGWKGSRLEWSWSGMGRQAGLPLWLLAASASQLMLSENVRMMGECGNPECRWLFLDNSKNHTRRWCEMKICGNRMKARRFKANRL